MATREAIRARNRRRRRVTDAFINFLVWIRNIILAIILLIVVFFAVVFISHHVNTNNEKELLADAGLYKQVLVDDDRAINVASYGNKDGEYTIVPIADIGTQNFTVYMQHMTANLKDGMHIALIDRAGYGFSDDSQDDQTVEQIISDYRTALNKAGIRGPYVLCAHEFGGVYATYWAAHYPDEIAGIVYLNGTILSEDAEIKNQPTQTYDRVRSVLYKFGFQRLVGRNLSAMSVKNLTGQEIDCSRALHTHSAQTTAYFSEISMMEENFAEALEALSNEGFAEIPKMYISPQAFTSDKEVIDYFKYKNEQHKALGLNPLYELNEDGEASAYEVAKFINKMQLEYKEPTKEFVKTLGNCQLVRIPGDDKIYEQKPDCVTAAMMDFLLYLNGDINHVKDSYEDVKLIIWEKYQETHKEEIEASQSKTNQSSKIENTENN